ncbi:MAG: phosphatidylserine decarboxylase [Flavobacteriales bacterium]|nr:phosphatidylserine decarboxylase [Flavobacteriales bacterium]
MSEIKFVNRSNGELITEQVPGGRAMSFIYTNPFGKLSLWLLIKRKLLSALFGKYMSSKASVSKVEPFIRKHKMDMSEYIVPEGGFSSFNDFFYRKVRPQFRKIGDGVISPADGRVLVFPDISSVRTFFVKGEEFSLSTFLQDDSLIKRYEGGSMCIIRLAPVDYHRYHFPVSGKASKNVKINGYYYSVSPIALQRNVRIFLENKREYSNIESNEFGNVLMCEVAATLTGGMKQVYIENENVLKGQEKGYFFFGGSTVILLFEKQRVVFSNDLIENTKKGLETWLKMGETIAN